MRVLILGVNGFIGNALTERILLPVQGPVEIEEGADDVPRIVEHGELAAVATSAA